MTEQIPKSRRQVFVLTPEEKKVVCFVAAALILGCATKHYRDIHPSPKPTSAIQPKAKRAARPHKPRKPPATPADPVRSTPAGGEDDDDS